MYSTLVRNSWAELVPYVQLAQYLAFPSTVGEARHCLLVFGPAAVLHVHIIQCIPATTEPQFELVYSRRTVEPLQLAYGLARRNLTERAD